MNKHLKNFLHRGLMFGGFGPIVAGIVYLSWSYTIDGFSLGGMEVFVAILSTYLLAFIHAGASVFYQIEEWAMAKSLLSHLSTLYAVYTLCYLINSWIPFHFKVLLVFTLSFVLLYFVVWICVVIGIKLTENKLNSKLK